VLVAQNTFARNLLLDRAGKWQVNDQYNTGRGSAQVVGVSALDTTGDGAKDVILLDRSSRSLVYLERKDGVYRPVGTLPIGPIDFQGMHVGDFDGDGRDDLLVAGTDRFAVVLTGKKGQRLRTIASYESNRRDARLADLIVGDLNGDKYPDVVLIDTEEHFVELATFSGKADLNRALAFRVFERKSFRAGAGSTEPRDLTLGDVDGDGLQDLILIVHDRILIYRQDPGPKPEEKPSPKP
ncbi:MAG: FG-GAP repeat domain-containing protein, partial [Isosphaeraceae bacterium]